MSVMYIVLPLALFFAAIFVGAFIWAVRHGQMDDLQTPAVRMLLDDDNPKPRRSAPAEKATNGTTNDTSADETVSHDAPTEA